VYQNNCYSPIKLLGDIDCSFDGVCFSFSGSTGHGAPGKEAQDHPSTHDYWITMLGLRCKLNNLHMRECQARCSGSKVEGGGAVEQEVAVMSPERSGVQLLH